MTYEKKNTVLMSRALNETSGKRYADGKEIEYNILGKTGEDFFMLRHASETEFIVRDRYSSYCQCSEIGKNRNSCNSQRTIVSK